MKIFCNANSVSQNRRIIKLFLRNLILGACLVAPMVGHASLAASDNAGNYTTSWNSGDNHGSGFGSWSFDNTSNGGSAGEYLATGNNGNSQINSSGNAWGMYANGSSTAQANAIRPFTGGALAVGQTLSFSMDNGFINSSSDNSGGLAGVVGVSLRNSSPVNIFELYFTGGTIDYTLNINGNSVTTSVGFTSTGLNLAFTQGSGNAWTFGITPVGGSTTTYTSAGTGDYLASSDIDEIRFFTQGTGSASGGTHDSFFNNLSITAVPEPITIALPIFGGIFGVVSLRRYLSQRITSAV